MNDPFRPILCLDFDGVIHDYKGGWQGGVIYGDITPGFFEWAEQASKLFKLVVYSSRSRDPAMLNDMMLWLGERRRAWRRAGGQSGPDPLEFEFAHEKPPAFLTIDDRAVQFRGDWTALPPSMLRTFVPWNTRTA